MSDVISEVVFGPFWLMLPGLEPNRYELLEGLMDIIAFLVKLWKKL